MSNRERPVTGRMDRDLDGVVRARIQCACGGTVHFEPVADPRGGYRLAGVARVPWNPKGPEVPANLQGRARAADCAPWGHAI